MSPHLNHALRLDFGRIGVTRADKGPKGTGLDTNGLTTSALAVFLFFVMNAAPALFGAVDQATKDTGAVATGAPPYPASWHGYQCTHLR